MSKKTFMQEFISHGAYGWDDLGMFITRNGVHRWIDLLDNLDVAYKRIGFTEYELIYFLDCCLKEMDAWCSRALFDIACGRKYGVNPARINDGVCLKCGHKYYTEYVRSPEKAVVYAFEKCTSCLIAEDFEWKEILHNQGVARQYPIYYFDKDGNSLGRANFPTFLPRSADNYEDFLIIPLVITDDDNMYDTNKNELEDLDPLHT